MTAPRPAWMARLTAALEHPDPEYFERFQPPEEGGRESAVLMLFAPSSLGGEDVVLTERAHHLRTQPGQVSFPGGSLEEGEGAVEAALREAHEEVGVPPAEVDVVAELPSLYLSPSRHVVTPVLGWWAEPGALNLHRGEVHRAERVRVDHLLDASIRHTTVHPMGYEGPAFEVDGLYVWGFTAMLFSRVMQLAGLERPWDAGDRRPLPERFHPRPAGPPARPSDRPPTPERRP
ncbi:MAG TPA: CoA pyrophosphatase [Pedococcus sp.]